MVNEKTIRKYIEEYGEISVKHFGPESERTIRRVLSAMRQEGTILISLPDQPNMRRRIEHCTDEEIEAYAKIQLASMQTQYFNTLLPIRKWVKNKTLLGLMGQFETIYEVKNDQLVMILPEAK